MWFYNTGKIFLERLKYNDDLFLSIKDTFKRSNIKMGFFMAIGATRTANIGFYDQKEKVYKKQFIDEPAEIISCIGNVSEVDGDISIHGHINLGLKDGTTKGGHLLEGTSIFACEIIGIALEGEQLKRIHDDITGLKLWGL
jgi:predicted DNA-binding protein with PD1-like motif